MNPSPPRHILVVGPAPELPDQDRYCLIGPFKDGSTAQDWLATNLSQEIDVAILHAGEESYGALISALQLHRVGMILFPGRP
jgi:hypothetical protein